MQPGVATETNKTAQRIGVPREVYPGEKRVATVPDVVGKLTKLGVKLGMTGAGAASRLKDYGITGIADGNMIDPAVIDSQIASERAKLQPHAEYLRTLLGL